MQDPEKLNMLIFNRIEEATSIVSQGNDTMSEVKKMPIACDLID